MLVYIAKNIVNNKVYIGITKRNLEKRVYEHLYSSNIPNKYLTIRFYNSIRKYGKDNIKWDILCECNSVEELLKKEEYFINLYDSTNPDKGYNMLKSSTFLDYKHTKEFKDNLSLLKTDVKSKNRRGVPGSSNYFGVVYIKTSGKWSSRITINKKLIFISNSNSEVEAAVQYDLYIINNNLDRKRNFSDEELNKLLITNNISYREKNINKTSNYYGVSFNNKSKRWNSQVWVDGKTKHIGSFNNEEDAAIAYNKFIIDNNLDLSLNDVDMSKEPISSKFFIKRGKYFGVSKKKTRFVAQIRHNKKHIYIGSYPTEEDAAKAYDDYIDLHKINKSKNFTNESLIYLMYFDNYQKSSFIL